MDERPDLKGDERPDTKSDLPRLSAEELEDLTEFSNLQKDEWRFVIGLATGALVLSVAFIHQIAPVPIYRWILILGWIALLMSILASIEMARQLQKLVIAIRSMKKWPEILSMIPFDKHVLVLVMSELFGEKEGEGKPTTQELREQYRKEWKPEDVKELYRVLIKIFKKKGKELRVVAEFLRIARALGRFSKQASPEGQIKSMRIACVLIYFLNPFSYYAFYAGIVLIAVFGVLNLIQ